MAKYKYILTVIFILCTLITYAQPAQYTPMTASGYQMKRLKVDSTLHLPSFCGVPNLRGSTVKDGALAIDTCGGYLYMWTNQLGWDTINVTTTGGGTQDLQSVLNNGNTSYNRDINLLGRSSGNQIYISPLDNNWMPFMALGDSIGGGLYQYTYPQATIEFINKYMSQKLKGQDSTRATIYLPVQTLDATDTLAKLSDVRDAITTPTLQQVTNAGATTTNQISVLGLRIANDGDSIALNRYYDGSFVVTRSNTSDELLRVNDGVGGYLKFGGGDGQFVEIGTNSSGNVSLQVPQIGGTIPISVNGNTADAYGNITISAGGVAVDTIFRTLGKDSIFYKKNNITYAIKDSVGTNPPASGYYGAFQDNTSQTAASINTAYAIKLNTTDLTNGVTVVNDGSSNPTRVTLANTGIYNIQFSLQLEKTGGSGNMIADIWIRKNGVDIPSTTGKVVLTGSANASPVVAAWNYVLDLAAGDYIQLMWATSNTNVEIVAAVATSPHPAIPSAILTVTQQSGIMAGTGITAINSLTGAAQTMVTGTDSTDFKIVSTGTTHKFNLPTASATNRGALSSANWTTFNSKLGANDTVSLSNRINLKLNSADTASLSNRINLKLNSADTASLSNRINGKLNITDTSTLQRKSISAYTILANKTPVTANATAQTFRDTSGVFDGSITWTATTAPSGATNHSYRLTQVGKCVTLNISLVYATNGNATSAILLTLPSNAPTPAQPTGLTGASQYIYVLNVQLATSANLMATTAATRGMMRNNSANNGVELFASWVGSSIAQVNLTIQYWTN